MYLIFKTSKWTYTLVYSPIHVLLVHHVECSIALEVKFTEHITYTIYVIQCAKWEKEKW